MTFRAEFTVAATRQAQAAAAWWRANRPVVRELFDIELAYAVDLLTEMPPFAQVWGEAEGKPVRKVRLPRVRYALSFTIDSLDRAAPLTDPSRSSACIFRPVV